MAMTTSRSGGAGGSGIDIGGSGYAFGDRRNGRLVRWRLCRSTTSTTTSATTSTSSASGCRCSARQPVRFGGERHVTHADAQLLDGG